MNALSLEPATAFAWLLRFLGASLFAQSVELLVVRRALSDTGIWRYQTLRCQLAHLPTPLRLLATIVFPYPCFLSLLLLQLGLATMMMVTATPYLLPVLLLTATLVCLRFRGTYNGGSDAMTLLCLLAASASLLGSSADTALRASLGYVAAQTTLSYFIAGLVKLRQPAWRDGEALRSFASLSRYGVPSWAKRMLDSKALSRAACLAVLLFECTFPLAWLSPTSCLLYVGAAVAFHSANALMFGLNRFLLAWLATYPALLCMAYLLSVA